MGTRKSKAVPQHPGIRLEFAGESHLVLLPFWHKSATTDIEPLDLSHVVVTSKPLEQTEKIKGVEHPAGSPRALFQRVVLLRGRWIFTSPQLTDWQTISHCLSSKTDYLSEEGPRPGLWPQEFESFNQRGWRLRFGAKAAEPVDLEKIGLFHLWIWLSRLKTEHDFTYDVFAAPLTIGRPHDYDLVFSVAPDDGRRSGDIFKRPAVAPKVLNLVTSTELSDMLGAKVPPIPAIEESSAWPPSMKARRKG